ncbi:MULTISPECIES: hypothetical protein [Streptomyces]|uniref:hypothetical protein n=1 Tax=Streptomyces TaxID=1883 RepID=UPI000474878F|nr:MULTISPECIES: hypothetical protein [Streptomyces]MYQ70821.1 hypothetical protein [Streptomyces sp. SID4934]RZE55506.1 hypothetical protein C0Q97_14790 [Streptomyces albidoflavus]WJK69360.1 hypothetical protein QIA47_23950 [Streptomyces albidoflavus]WQG72425.1 hypothetical protein SR864_15220 [Streptomyces albidoflavus]WSB15583.1 hypothetical protein OHB37_16035 [Streptomyces albidoflavus]
MRASTRALRYSALVAAVPTGILLTASQAFAAPDPPDDGRCDLVVGAAKEFCESEGSSSGGGTSSTPDPLGSTLDPLSSLAKGCAQAAAWTVDKLSDAVDSTANVDFTNPQFLQQYAVVFAASTVLTLLLWLLAVAKRAVRGVPLTTALSEAIGFLWLTVLASAFTPLILYTVVSATDSVTTVLAKSTGGQTDAFFGTFSEALKKGEDIGGGPIMLIVVSLVSILAAGVLWLELVIRAALLYVGALLGTVVYAGLVDKNLWKHVRRWAGIMIAVILVKPVIVIVLGLAGALSSEDGPNAFSAVVSGLAIILLAIFASAMIYRFVPGFGDEIAASRNNRLSQGAEGRAAAVLSSPAALVSQGIKAHSGRQSGDGGGASQPRPANQASGGMAAHASRGGSGGSPSAPPPRSGNPVNSPHAGSRGSSTGSPRSGGDGR